MPWPTVALADVCEFRYGKSLPAVQRRPGTTQVYGSNGRVGSHQEALTAGPTIIIGRKGSVGEIHYSSEPCWPIDTTYFVDEAATDADLRWLAHRLSGMRLTGMNKAAAVPGLNREDVYRLELLLPPTEEQRRIADILDRADALRAKRREALTLLDDLTQSIFLDMFGDPIANDGREEVDPLIDWVDPRRPITYGILKPGDHRPAGVPYVRVMDMNGRGIETTSLRRTSSEISQQYKRSLLRAGDLLISIRGHVGRAAEVPGDADGANITQDSARLAVAPESAIYVLECLRTDAVQNWMRRRTKGAAVQGINLGDLKLLPIPVVPAEQQRLFAAKARSVEILRRAASRQAATAEESVRSIRQRAFAGKL